MLFRNIIIALIPVSLLASSCSDSIPEKQANNVSAKVLKAKDEIPACCAKKPSRFSPLPKKSLK